MRQFDWLVVSVFSLFIGTVGLASLWQRHGALAGLYGLAAFGFGYWLRGAGK